MFPEAPLAVTKKEGFLYCPGISDDTASLACLLSLVRAIRHAGLKPAGELVFGGTVGEEDEGNSRGIRRCEYTFRAQGGTAGTSSAHQTPFTP